MKNSFFLFNNVNNYLHESNINTKHFKMKIKFPLIDAIYSYHKAKSCLEMRMGSHTIYNSIMHNPATIEHAVNSSLISHLLLAY
jgi:hypothetical protein